jgi:hypothetical protein
MGTVNMNQFNKLAYVRGLKAAEAWKHMKYMLRSWDYRCATWAKNHNAPVWVGRIPLVVVILISLAALFAGGMIVALIVIFIWAIVFILQNIGQNDSASDSNIHAPLSEYKDGPQGYGLYCGAYRIDQEDD